METIGKLAGGVAAVTGLIFLLTIIRTLTGAVIGFIVGLFFSGAILGFFDQLGMNLTMWQLGATLGFISGFFHQTQVKSE